MNPEVWDLHIVLHPTLSSKHGSQHLERIRRKGYLVTIDSRERLDEIKDRMQGWFMFTNAGLDDWGVQNLYVPKLKHWQRCREAYGPGVHNRGQRASIEVRDNPGRGPMKVRYA